MKLLPIIAAALMAATGATGASAPTGEPYVVKWTGGGSLAKFEKRFTAMQDRPVEIRGKACASSCTMWLSHPNVCIEPQTVFGFHGPSDAVLSLVTSQLTIIPVYHFMPLKKRRHAVSLMADHYRLNGNESLGNWFIDSGAWKLYGWFLKNLSGQEVHDKFGTPICEPLPYKHVATVATR